MGRTMVVAGLYGLVTYLMQFSPLALLALVGTTLETISLGQALHGKFNQGDCHCDLNNEPDEKMMYQALWLFLGFMVGLLISSGSPLDSKLVFGLFSLLLGAFFFILPMFHKNRVESDL